MATHRIPPTAPVAFDTEALKAFKEALRGDLVQPADERYDVVRQVWNAMIDLYPALVARCAGAADVIAAVTFARTNDLLVSIRGGGHNVAGKALCDGGLVIDLSLMKGIRVDPVARTVRAEPGLTQGEFDRETQAFGLSTTGGVVGTTGIAGLTLGGGQGWLNGKHRLTCDNSSATSEQDSSSEVTSHRYLSARVASNLGESHRSNTNSIPLARCWPGRSSTPSNGRVRSSVSTASSSHSRLTNSRSTPGSSPIPMATGLLLSCRVTPVTSALGNGCSGRCVNSSRRSRISSVR